jgi:hypothetical protein
MAAALTAGATSAVALAAATPAQAAISCYDSTDNGKTWYDGPTASYRYDVRFSGGPALSPTVLDSRTPQGLGTWHDWDGGTADLLVYAGYRNGSDAYIQGINPANGNRTTIARIADSHVGGVAISGGWAFVSGRAASDGHHTIRKYRLRDLRAAFKSSSSTYVKQVGEARHVYGASFIASQGGYLFAGKFNQGGRDKMYRYKVNADGSLTTQTGAITVPMKTQGLAVTKGHFFFSTSYGRENRSNVYVVKRGASLDGSGATCFRAPSMSEGMTLWDNKAYLLFESGSYAYRGDSKTRNVITRLHKVKVGDLTSLLG